MFIPSFRKPGTNLGLFKVMAPIYEDLPPRFPNFATPKPKPAVVTTVLQMPDPDDHEFLTAQALLVIKYPNITQQEVELQIGRKQRTVAKTVQIDQLNSIRDKLKAIEQVIVTGKNEQNNKSVFRSIARMLERNPTQNFDIQQQNLKRLDVTAEFLEEIPDELSYRDLANNSGPLRAYFMAKSDVGPDYILDEETRLMLTFDQAKDTLQDNDDLTLNLETMTIHIN